MSVSIAEIVAAVRAGEASLVSESAGYVVLGLADAAAKQARAFQPGDVGIDEQGDIVCRGASASPEHAERRIRDLLGWLLAGARTPSPNLRRVAERPDAAGLPHLVVELEAALVPVNRKAARRSLARLCRETTRALERGVKEADDFALEPVKVESQAAGEASEELALVAQGRRESIPPTPMKSTRPEPLGDGPLVVSDGRFDALRKLAALRAEAAQQQAACGADQDEELDVEVEVELTPLLLSAVAPSVAPLIRTPALPMAWPAGAGEPAASAVVLAAPPAADPVPVEVVHAVLEVPPLEVPAPDVTAVVASIDTTPTTVLARVAEVPEKGQTLSLFAPTPVSSAVDTAEEVSPPAPLRRSPSEAPHRPSDVSDLLARFGAVTRTNDRELLRGLERLSGIERGRVVQAASASTEERLSPSPVVAVR